LLACKRNKKSKRQSLNILDILECSKSKRKEKEAEKRRDKVKKVITIRTMKNLKRAKIRIPFRPSRKEKKIRIIKILLFAAAVLLAAALYLNFFFALPCKEKTCFDRELAACKKATYTRVAEEATWFYKIIGKTNDGCLVYVKNLEVKAVEKVALKDKDMLCTLPLNVVILPETAIDKCHGLLKEELQDLIIEKMHLYIVQHIGEIKEELKKPL